MVIYTFRMNLIILRMVHVAALVLPGTFIASVSPLLDAFRITQERSGRTVGGENGPAPELHLSLLSIDGHDVDIDGHATLRVDGSFDQAKRCDFLWIPAFRAMGEAQMRERLAESLPVRAWLRGQVAGGALVGASGAAIALPIAAGLANELEVPVAAALAPLFRTLFPRFRHGADLALADYPQFVFSRGIAHDAQALTAAFSRTFSPESGRWLRAVFGSDTLADEEWPDDERRDPLVTRARLLLEQRFTSPVSLAELSAELSVSHPVLIRRFRRVLGTTPSQYLRQLRLNAAQRMLRHTDRPVDSIAAAVGFGDSRLLRQMFRQATGMSATRWRATQRQSRPT